MTNPHGQSGVEQDTAMNDLQRIVGRTIKAVERHRIGDNDFRERLSLTLDDGSRVVIESQDASDYQSWLTVSVEQP